MEAHPMRTGSPSASGHTTMREASRVIGVHENTLRKWAQRGIIQTIHLPGSGFQRVPETEVERIRADMWRGVPNDEHEGFAPRHVPKGVVADDGYDEPLPR
jgi:hypothetical protein